MDDTAVRPTPGPDSAAEPDRPSVAGSDRRFLSLSAALDGHRNSLGLLRLVFAVFVIIDHAYPLGGFGHDPLWDKTRGQASFGSIAVLGFFGISGYLIAKSGMTADVLQFLWRRVLRIFPAFWTLLVVTAFVVGPVFWILDGHSLSSYFVPSDGVIGPVDYVVKNWSLYIGTYALKDIFATTTPYGSGAGSVLNGSLWSLAYEWQAYLIVAVLVVFGVLTRAKLVVPALAAFVVVVQAIALVDPEALAAYLPFMSDPQRPPLLLTFLVGSTMAVFSRTIPFDHGLGLFSILLTLVSLRYGGFSILGPLAGTYAIFYIAAVLPKRVQWIGAKNDYSYGVYIYGFLVQQMLAYVGLYRLGFVPYVCGAVIIAFGCAWLSWHLVEKRAMSLKDWGPGRGISPWVAWARPRLESWKSKSARFTTGSPRRTKQGISQ
jgi:peptidoglycan/LPS O-acetylase OafA/YrhL